MISRSQIRALLAGLVVLGAAFAVLMGFHALVMLVGDAVGARALLWAAMICLIALVVDLLLLVTALGLRAAYADDKPARDESQ